MQQPIHGVQGRRLDCDGGICSFSSSMTQLTLFRKCNLISAYVQLPVILPAQSRSKNTDTLHRGYGQFSTVKIPYANGDVLV